MPESAPKLRLPEYLILTGSAVFVFVLALSAYFERDIRWLHFFQAWMYLVPCVLIFQKNRWGYFVGISAAGFWAYTGLFVTTFVWNGVQELSRWIASGHLQRLDLLIAIPAWIANILVVTGCVWAYSRLADRSVSDAAKFVMAFAMTIGFFALDMYLFQPRYLPLIRGALHPRLPW